MHIRIRGSGVCTTKPGTVLLAACVAMLRAFTVQQFY